VGTTNRQHDDSAPPAGSFIVMTGIEAPPKRTRPEVGLRGDNVRTSVLWLIPVGILLGSHTANAQQACDSLATLKLLNIADGLIENPRACAFDPKVLA